VPDRYIGAAEFRAMPDEIVTVVRARWRGSYEVVDSVHMEPSDRGLRDVPTVSA
jgi:hypothetical protein